MNLRTTARKTLAAVALTAAAGTAFVGLASGTANAQASSGFVGGSTPVTFTYANSPGVVLATAYCDSNRITVSVQASASQGVASQWISYRYWVRNGTGFNSYSGYAAPQLAVAQQGNVIYPYVSFASNYVPGVHQFWDVKVEVIRWTGSQWQSSWYQPVYKLQNGSYNSSYCLT